MKKILGSIKKQKSGNEARSSNDFRNAPPVPTGDGPEAVIYREVGAFCESGAPGSNTTGDEYLHLPAIVDAAESSPSAANQAAVRIRGYLGRDHYDRGFAQYNAIMLLRILTDNPGRGFTQFLDKEFIATVKKLLKDGKDSSVQQILRETLDYFEVKSHENNTLEPLMEMWRKEKGASARIIYPRGSVAGRAPPMPPRPRGLPPPDELAGRIEEARTTARLLVQTVQSTPTHELLQNDLVKEFAERAKGAQRSIQGYMNAENPHPDDDTMLTLIETSEQLNVAMTKHQRAVLQARKATGASPSPQPQSNPSNSYMTAGENVYGQSQPSGMQRPLQPQPQYPPQSQYREQNSALSPPVTNGQGRASPINEQFNAPPGPPPGRPTSNVYSNYQTQPTSHTTPATTTGYTGPTATSQYDVADNPFADSAGYEQPQQQSNYSLFGRNSSPGFQPPAQKPYNPPQQSQNDAYQSNRSSQYNSYGQPPTQGNYSQSNRNSQPPQDSYSQTNRNSQPTYGQPVTEDYPQPQYSPQRPGPAPAAYNQGYQPTPSYMHRQDSAAQNITMHGASPVNDERR